MEMADKESNSNPITEYSNCHRAYLHLRDYRVSDIFKIEVTFRDGKNSVGKV